MVRTIKSALKLLLLIIIGASSFYAGSILADYVLPYTDCAKDLRCMQNSSIGDKISEAIGAYSISSNCKENQEEVCDVVTMCMEGPCPWNDCRCVDVE